MIRLALLSGLIVLGRPGALAAACEIVMRSRPEIRS